MEGNGSAIGRPQNAANREGQVVTQIIRNQDAQRMLADQIARLEERLAGILKGPQPQDSAKEGLSPTLVPIAEELAKTASSTVSLATKLGCIIDRIEL